MMDESETFRANLLVMMRERGMTAAGLSRDAGLNARAVKDIEERKTASPKLSTVFALARALGVPPGELMGLQAPLHAQLVAYLSRYSEDEQARLLEALERLPRL